MRRILVTGSREWPRMYQRMVSLALNVELDYANKHDVQLVVVHGACPTGVDKMVDEWHAINRGSVIRREAEIERHPAQWDLLGKSAGFKRNEYMVSLGATKCLAFIFSKSKGATHCADKAQAAGIRVVRFRIDAT